MYQPISTDWNTVTRATYNLIIDTLQQHCVVCWLLCVSSHCGQWGLTWCTSPYQLTGSLWQERHIIWSLSLYSSTVWFVDCCVSIAIVCSEGSHLLQLWSPGVPAHINWLEHCDIYCDCMISVTSILPSNRVISVCQWPLCTRMTSYWVTVMGGVHRHAQMWALWYGWQQMATYPVILNHTIIWWL